jgi:hypothetical protein
MVLLPPSFHHFFPHAHEALLPPFLHVFTFLISPWRIPFLLCLLIPPTSWWQLHTVATRLAPLLSFITNYHSHHPLCNNTFICFQHYSWRAWPLTTGPTGCPAISVTKYQPKLHNITTEQRSQKNIC